MIIAIDGPAGTGKSTIAKLLSEKLGYAYFDTGAMYRACTFWLQKSHVNLEKNAEIRKALKNFHYDVHIDEKDNYSYFVDGLNVTDDIRKSTVSKAVSEVAANPLVREFLVPVQRGFAKKRKNLVVEGRDIGTVIFPKAKLKIFLTASLPVRAQRRLEQLKRKFPDLADKLSLDEEMREIEKRDSLDSTRKVSPLRCPNDAFVIDTSDLTIEESTKQILKKIPCERSRFFPPLLSCRFLYGFILGITYLYLRLFYRLKVFGRENFPKGKTIIASNHSSFLDPPAIAVSCPTEIHFLARASLFKKFLLGRLITNLNSHPIGSKSDLSILKLILQLLSQGKKVLLFPEGTRSKTGELGKILPGIGFLAYHSKAPILPILIKGTEHIWPAKKRFPKFFGKITCVIGSPLSSETYAYLEKKESMEAITKNLVHAFEQLEHWVKEGKRGSPP